MGDSRKLVTIIVPAYNVENYIDRCVESIINQTYSDIEVLIVDDGSTDGTWSHIKSLMERDDRVKGFHRDNSGVSATRNFALAQAEGEYIQFVDADDYLKSDATEILVNAIESSDASLVSSQHQLVDEVGQPLENFDFIKGNKVLDTEEARFKIIMEDLLEYHIGYEVWNKLYRTSVIRDHEIAFPEDCHIGEDLAFNISYIFNASSMNCIEDRIYFYYIRSDSAMGNGKELSIKIKEYTAIVKAVEPYFNKAFTGKIKGCFYQLFYKILLLGSLGHSAEETSKVVRSLGDDYFFKNLDEALKHKSDFDKFLNRDMAIVYYRYGLYIKGDTKSKLYLKLYDIYRVMRGREPLTKWRLS